MIKEYTFFSYYHRTYTETDHILGYRANLIKFKRTEIILNVFSHQNGLKLEITNRKITGRLMNIWKVNNTLLYSPWVKEEVSKETKNIPSIMKMRIPHFKICGTHLKHYYSTKHIH